MARDLYKRRHPERWRASKIHSLLRVWGIELSMDGILAWMQRTPTCAYCTLPIKPREYSPDHILPRSRGGADSLANLHLICKSCNLMKGALTDGEFRDLLAYLKDRPAVYRILKMRLKAAGMLYAGH